MMKRDKILGLVVVASALCCWYFRATAEEAQQQANLVVNWSFESDMESWQVPEDHHPDKVSIDTTTSTDGEKSIKLDATTTEDEIIFIDAGQDLEGKLKPSTEYIVKADIKRTSAEKNINLIVLESPEKGVDWTYHICGAKADKLNVWEHFEARFKTNSQVARANIRLYNTMSGGIAWYDNIQLVEAGR